MIQLPSALFGLAEIGLEVSNLILIRRNQAYVRGVHLKSGRWWREVSQASDTKVSYHSCNVLVVNRKYDEKAVYRLLTRMSSL